VDNIGDAVDKMDPTGDIESFIKGNPTGLNPPDCVIKDYLRQLSEKDAELDEKDWLNHGVSLPISTHMNVRALNSWNSDLLG
jgi:hypothetical protein